MGDQTLHLAHAYVKLNGTILPEAYMDALMSVEVDHSRYLPAMFTLLFSDKGLGILTGATPGPGFKLGDVVEIAFRSPETTAGGRVTVGQKVKIIEAEVTTIEPDLNSSDRGTLLIRGFDRSHRLKRARKTQTYLNMTDSDIASKVAQGAGLQASVDATSVVHKFLMQTNQTDFEFLLERARRIGYQMYVEDRTLYFKKPPTAPPAGPELDWGINMDQFRARMSTIEQVNEVIVRGWDPQAKAEVVGQASSPTGAKQNRRDNGRTGGQAATAAHGITTKQVIVDRPVTSVSEANAIAQAELDAIASNFIQAEGSTGGNPLLKAGVTVKIKGVGDRFGGEYLVTRVIHKYTGKGYSCHFWCNGGKGNMSIVDLLKSNNGTGSANRVAAEERVTSRGVMIGIVTNNQDPDNLGRVRVKFPTLAGTEGWWCRLGTPMAGPGQGFAYFPEANDEVVVAFEHGDPSRGVILGSVWNGTDKLPKPIGQLVTGSQTIRRITRTRKGHEFVLIDKPGEEGIELIDRTTKNFIKIITDKNKIHIECTGDVEVTSTQGNINATAKLGNVTVKADAGKMTMQSLQDMELTATGRVKITGTAGVEVFSPAQTKVGAGGNLDLTGGAIASVKAGMVKLG